MQILLYPDSVSTHILELISHTGIFQCVWVHVLYMAEY